ncbi:MAG TPA: hypothetical protein VLH12_02970 [Usitatibacter sp.]|nr:hypothetical protein [Usitatibacter sp.]
MKRLPALLLCLAAPAFAADPPAADKPFSATLAPKAMHEECMKLQSGEKRNYYWKADNAVDFNIHYHDGPEVFYPVKRDGMRGDGGSFAAKIGQDYCWMWTARDKPVKLEGRIESK